jgi:hypothetical protein
MWVIRIYGIMMCQHMDAWYIHRKMELTDLQQLIYTVAA